jgi:hypothetical protein
MKPSLILAVASFLLLALTIVGSLSKNIEPPKPASINQIRVIHQCPETPSVAILPSTKSTHKSSSSAEKIHPLKEVHEKESSSHHHDKRSNIEKIQKTFDQDNAVSLHSPCESKSFLLDKDSLAIRKTSQGTQQTHLPPKIFQKLIETIEDIKFFEIEIDAEQFQPNSAIISISVAYSLDDGTQTVHIIKFSPINAPINLNIIAKHLEELEEQLTWLDVPHNPEEIIQFTYFELKGSKDHVDVLKKYTISRNGDVLLQEPRFLENKNESTVKEITGRLHSCDHQDHQEGDDDDDDDDDDEKEHQHHRGGHHRGGNNKGHHNKRHATEQKESHHSRGDQKPAKIEDVKNQGSVELEVPKMSMFERAAILVVSGNLLTQLDSSYGHS